MTVELRRRVLELPYAPPLEAALVARLFQAGRVGREDILGAHLAAVGWGEGRITNPGAMEIAHRLAADTFRRLSDSSERHLLAQAATARLAADVAVALLHHPSRHGLDVRGWLDHLIEVGILRRDLRAVALHFLSIEGT